MARLNFHSDLKKKKKKVKQIIAKVTTCLHIVLEFRGLAEASDTERVSSGSSSLLQYSTQRARVMAQHTQNRRMREHDHDIFFLPSYFI